MYTYRAITYTYIHIYIYVYIQFGVEGLESRAGDESLGLIMRILHDPKHRMKIYEGHG